MFQKSIVILSTLLLLGCQSYSYPTQPLIGTAFPNVSGESLEQQQVQIPSDFGGEPTLLLLGYKQASQFDIDRWLIGLDMTGTEVNTFEIPTIKGMLPGLFSHQIDSGMRSGIPKPLWSSVITVYQDGDRVQRYTGNQKPNNARVLLLDGEGRVQYFYDSGFSVDALNQLRARLDAVVQKSRAGGSELAQSLASENTN